jgi:hypothetical protein
MNLTCLFIAIKFTVVKIKYNSFVLLAGAHVKLHKIEAGASGALLINTAIYDTVVNW